MLFGLTANASQPGGWRYHLDLIDNTLAAGGKLIGQTHCRPLMVLISFRTRLPFDRLPVWCDVRRLPEAEQLAELRQADVRATLVESATAATYDASVGAEVKPPNYETMLVVQKAWGHNPSVADLARAREQHPVETIIDLAIRSELGQFFAQPFANDDREGARALLEHPGNVMSFSDSGAHVSQISDTSIHTQFLAEWVRDRNVFSLEEAIRMITSVPAAIWGFADRGLVRPGYAADLNVFDPDSIQPELPSVVNDLPTGAPRLLQKSSGIAATIVNGEIIVEGGESTDAVQDACYEVRWPRSAEPQSDLLAAKRAAGISLIVYRIM